MSLVDAHVTGTKTAAAHLIHIDLNHRPHDDSDRNDGQASQLGPTTLLPGAASAQSALVGPIQERLNEYARWMYRSGRPNWVARPQNRMSSVLFGAGIFPRRVASLEVKGRRSGRTISFPVVIADWEGDEYLVSMLGEQANWVKNVRAVGGDAVLRRGRREEVTLKEVDVADRAPIIRRYAAVAPGGRPHLGLRRDASIPECEVLAPNTPVFRITSSVEDEHHG
jgi:deazaflavin-dependent oxidoreductase (nitroreductase family)